jgi:hypothetical protein
MYYEGDQYKVAEILGTCCTNRYCRLRMAFESNSFSLTGLSITFFSSFLCSIAECTGKSRKLIHITLIDST